MGPSDLSFDFYEFSGDLRISGLNLQPFTIIIVCNTFEKASIKSVLGGGLLRVGDRFCDITMRRYNTRGSGSKADAHKCNEKSCHYPLHVHDNNLAVPSRLFGVRPVYVSKGRIATIYWRPVEKKIA